MSNSKDEILWVDCLGGLAVGGFVLLFYRLLSDWDSLPTAIVVAMGVANLAYGSYSLFVTLRKPRPLLMVKLLAIANMLWLVICLALAIAYWRQISWFGILHVVGEGIYVATLGLIEWKRRVLLAG
jgi:hypothetical protein